MANFASTYRTYIRNASEKDEFGFKVRALGHIEPFLKFMYEKWWRVNFVGLEKLPTEGPALIVGNNNGLITWPGLMLMYALMSSQSNPRRVRVVINMDWITNDRVLEFVKEIGYVSFSSENVKKLLSQGELVAMFPEGSSRELKTYSERNRVREFDWTWLLPAIEEGVKIYPLSTLGCDESTPSSVPLEKLAKAIDVPTFPITPFLPWMPFPINLGTFPIRWKMSMLRPTSYQSNHGENRGSLEDTTIEHTKFIEGEIQAELNRMVRARHKSYI